MSNRSDSLQYSHEMVTLGRWLGIRAYSPYGVVSVCVQYVCNSGDSLANIIFH